MSDFLTRLAERALGVTPAVEPRVRALYEPDLGDRVTAQTGPRLDPPAPVSKDVAEHLMFDASAQRSIGRTDQPTARQPSAAASRVREPIAPRITPEQTSVDRVHEDHRAPLEPTPQRAEPTDGTRTDAHVSDASAEPDRRNVREPNSIADSFPIVSDEDTEHRRERHVVPSRRAVFEAPTQHSATLEPIAPDQRRSSAPPRLVPARVGRSEDDRSAGARDVTTTRRESVPSLGVHAAIEAPIHVSIGRIEVTAVTSTPRTRERTKARARVPLDEYLAERRRGPR